MDIFYKFRGMGLMYCSLIILEVGFMTGVNQFIKQALNYL